MIIEVLRLFTTGLLNSTYGINQQIGSLDVFSGDTVPPNVISISDESQNIVVANSRILKPMPSIAVVQAGPAELDPNVLTTVRDGEVTIGIRYYAENSQTQNIRRNALYTMRALEKFLQDFFNDTNDADRIINNIQVCAVLDLRHESITAFEEDNILIGQLTLTLLVRDTRP